MPGPFPRSMALLRRTRASSIELPGKYRATCGYEGNTRSSRSANWRRVGTVLGMAAAVLRRWYGAEAQCGHDAAAEHERYRLNRHSNETIFRRFRHVFARPRG